MGTFAETDTGQYGVCVEYSCVGVYGGIGAGSPDHGEARRPCEKATAFICGIGSMCGCFGIITAIGSAICRYGISLVLCELSTIANRADGGAGDCIGGAIAGSDDGEGEYFAASGTLCYVVTGSSGAVGGHIVCTKYVWSDVRVFFSRICFDTDDGRDGNVVHSGRC